MGYTLNFHILGDKHPHLALFLPESVAKSVAKYQETSIAMPSMLKQSEKEQICFKHGL